MSLSRALLRSRQVAAQCYLELHTNDLMILEQLITGIVIGSLPGLPGNGRRISFRILHVFEFGIGLISRENAWLDSARSSTN
jgi:hypothetical protein